MIATLHNLAWAVVFCFVGGVVGIMMVLFAASYVPRILDKLTPALDEGKEIARGNQAVAEYFGRLVSSAIIGISIVVAAAVLGGIIAALH